MTESTASTSRILLVTDDEHEKELMSFMLSCGGFDTQIALNAETALTLSARNRYPVVVIDMASSKLDCLDIAKRLGEILDFRSHALIAINAPAQSELRKRLLKLHCSSFIETNAASNLCTIISAAIPKK